jgi:hypothetical protein
MRGNTGVGLLLGGVLFSGGCGTSLPRSTGSPATSTASPAAAPVVTEKTRAMTDTYLAYLRAVRRDDLAGAKSYLAAGRLSQIASLPDREALAELDVVSPLTAVKAYDSRIEGDEATLIVGARVDGNEATGTIEMLRENGAWKIRSVTYNLGEAPDASALQQAARPADMSGAQTAAWRRLQEAGFPRPDKDYLVMTARQGKLPMVKLFLEAGFPIESRDNTSETALIASSRAGQADVALYLIGAGADVNAADQINMTPLLGAAGGCGMTDVLRTLLARGARPDARTAGGATAVELAEGSGCSANADLLRAPSSRR